MISNLIVNKFTALINIIFPSLCPSCKSFIANNDGICTTCTKDLYYIGDNHCKICHMPFDLAVGNDITCGECLKTTPFYDKLYAPFVYEGTIIKLILQYKHGDAVFLMPILSRLMVSYIKKHRITADMIMPVPLHFKKLLKRKYNQSLLLAGAISKACDMPCYQDILQRTKNGSQKGKNKQARQDNVRNNFHIPHPQMIRGKKILLVDDVVTTGATVNEIARILKKNGASQVIVISLARVSQNHHNDIDF